MKKTLLLYTDNIQEGKHGEGDGSRGTIAKEKLGVSDILSIPKFIIDLREAWDTQSQNELFLQELKKLPIYKKNLLYCGVFGDKINPRKSGKTFATNELGFGNTISEHNNPVSYALSGDNPTIIIYNKDLLEETLPEEYIIKTSSACVGVFTLRT